MSEWIPMLWLTGWSFSWFLLGWLYHFSRVILIVRNSEKWLVRYDKYGEVYMLIKPEPPTNTKDTK